MQKMCLVFLAMQASLSFGAVKQITLGTYLDSLHVLGDSKSAFVFGTSLSSSSNSEAFQLDLSNGQVLQKFALPASDATFDHIKFDVNGKYALVSGLDDYRDDYEFLWNLNTDTFQPLIEATSYANQFEFSRDGRFVFSLYYERGAQHFTCTDLATGVVKTVYDFPADHYDYWIPLFKLDETSNAITFTVNRSEKAKLLSVRVVAFDPDLGTQLSESVTNPLSTHTYWQMPYAVAPDYKYLLYVQQGRVDPQYVLREVATGRETILPRSVSLTGDFPANEQFEFRFVNHFLLLDVRGSKQSLQVYDIDAGSIKNLGFTAHAHFLLGADQIGICSEPAPDRGPCPMMSIFSTSTFDFIRRLDFDTLSPDHNIRVYSRSNHGDLIVVRGKKMQHSDQDAEVFKVPLDGSAPSKVGEMSGLSEYYHPFPECQFAADMNSAVCVDIVNHQHILNQISF